MTSILLPESEAELEAIVHEAAASRSPLAIHGGGTRDIGRPVQAARILSTQAMTGITLYEPTELVIAARPGTRLSEIEAALAQNRQRLAFEPIDYRPLLGAHGEPTIGGVTASNASGPRRIQAGAARDHLIGVRAVTGRGETIKSGGRVMKNVTGYDFVKLLAGSWGTLGVMTEVTYKLLPEAETETTLVIEGLSAERAVEAMAAALGTPFEITGAAHIPGAPSRTYLRFEGFAASCSYRAERLRAMLRPFGAAEAVEHADSRAIWRSIRDVEPLRAAHDEVVWRISVKPSDGPAIGAKLAFALDSRLLYDWAGGLVWATAPAKGDGGAEIVRAAVALVGGHATLIRAPFALRAAVPVFQPETAGVAAISKKIKATFDPSGVLNPGRVS
ncbi:glycolate oxidase subunit GlcE [Kaistia dalseonensis]|uniref:Glycolate oxidase FAD binding subunit n=1 Tax=Kaistia dalseonensis TaxID=410840 RepID=A0ABU0H6Y7_9HYPH|nr:glycolate oxidase subunit GlcE [Kaistia dalseonensis]MCX5495478.1 glycolate oxidase subunit GlcE [Kaistia dalseonensis]MDQ0438069.1 glycolate oxidase FAD binding subunit [Kaistia dalseonensis]